MHPAIVRPIKFRTSCRFSFRYTTIFRYTTMMGGAFQTISTKIRTKMTERFGGLTAYTRASAEGLRETIFSLSR